MERIEPRILVADNEESLLTISGTTLTTCKILQSKNMNILFDLMTVIKGNHVSYI